VQYAFSTGRVVPIEVMVRLDQTVSAADGLSVVAAPAGPGERPTAEAAAPGAPAIEISRFVSLPVAHAGLARAITPARPEALLLMADERERHPLWSAFGPLPLVRQMLGLALLSLVVLLAVSIDAAVNKENMAKSLLELSGFPLLMVEAFLVSAVSLGACFANLQRINTFISEGTYDPRFQSTYWTRWVMGVISGSYCRSSCTIPFWRIRRRNSAPVLRARSRNRSWHWLAAIPSISSTAFSGARSIPWAISLVSRPTQRPTISSARR
jgi:hypothetical protein